nr:microtubule-associated protein futsch isoform X2 [Nothobranchius furzeri]
MNRRKLGSNRRREGRQNVKQPEPEQDPEPRNYVQEETRRFEPQETRVSAATQLEIQEESGHEKHSSLSAKHDPSFVSTMTCKYSEVKTSSAMPCSEDAFKTAVGKDGNMQACKETKLEVPEADDSAQREGIKENMHQCLPEWHSLNISTLPSLEHEIIKQEDSCTFSVAERKSKNKYDEGLSVQDESLQGNYPVRESHVRTLVSDYFMPETTTDNGIITVDRESENSTEQTVVLLPSRELSTNEYAEELFKLPKVRDGVLTEETLKKMGKKDKKLTQMQHLHQIAAQSTVLHATEDYDAPKNIEFEINTHRFQLVAKVTDEQNPWAAKENNVDEINDSDPKQIRKSQLVPSVSLFEGGEFVEEDKLGAEQSIHQKTDFFEGEKNDFSVNSPLLDLNAPDFPLQAKSSSTDEQNNSNLKFGGARLKLVSSQRNKGRQHVKDIKDDVMGDEAFETSKVSFKIKTEDLKNLSETELSVLSSVSNGNSISLKNWPAHYSEVQTFEPTKNPTTEPQSLILTGEEHPRSHDKKRPNTKKEKVEELVDITQKEVVAESLPCENAKDVHSAELQGAEVYASQTQQHLITVKGYATQTCEIFSGNLTGCVEMTEPTIISTDDSDTKLDENIVEAVVQKSKNMDVHYTNQSKISDVDMANSGQVHDLKDRVEDVQEPNTKLIFSKKKGVHFYSEKDSVNVQSEMVDEKVYIGALTKLKEPQQLDYASGTVMDDAQDYVEIVGNVDSQSKISAMMQSRFAEKSDDETATKEKVLPKSGTIIFAAENVDLEVVGHRNKDDSANVSQQTMIHRIGEETMNYKSRTFVERDVTQNAGKGIFSEADRKEVSVVSPLPHLNAPPDLQLQNKSLSTDKKADANFSLSENRRKLGSSHKKKRRKSSKESKEEYLESTNEDKEVETSQLLKIQTAEQEDSSKGNEHKIMSTSQDSSMSLMSESQRIFPENENLEHDQEKRKLDIGTTMITSDVISETTQRKVQELKVHPKQMKESLQTGYPESLTGHAEMSMLTMKSGGDDSGVKEVDYPTTRNILDDSDLKADDYDLSDTEKQPIRDTVDSSLSQVYEFKVRVEDEVKPNTEQMFHQEKERLFSEPEDKSASTLQSETISSESQPQKDSETKDEQTSRALSSSDRRKLGSSRRNKRGQRVKESTDEVLENSKADESIDTTLVSLKEKTVIQEKLTHELQSDVNVFLPHECSMFTVLVSSSEVHSSGTKDNPDTHLESFIIKTVNPPVHPDQKDKNIDVKTFDKSGEAKPLKKSDSPKTKEVISLHGPIIVAEQKQRPETLQTQEQESLQIDQTHDPKTNDVLENPQTVSGILVDHSEIIKTRPSEFTQRSNNDSITKQEMLTQEDKMLMSSTTETSLNAAVQINEDIPVVGPKQIWITRTGVETAMCLHEDEEVVDKDKKHRAGQSVHQEGDLSEVQWKDVSVLSPLSSLDAPSDLQLQDKPQITDEQTDPNFSFSGHRRKLGSSRKNKEKQHGKGPKEEDSENFKDEELETSQLLKIQTAGQEDLSQGNEHKVVLSTSQDSSMPLMFESQRIIPEKLQHDKDKRKPDIKTEMMEEPVDLTQQGVDQIQTFDKEKTSDVISESIQREVQEVKVHPKQMKESLQTGYPESLTGHAEMSMLTMKSGGDDSGVKEVDYPTTRNILDDSDLKADDYDLSDTEKQPIRDTVDSSLSQVYEFKVRVEDEVKPNTEQMFHQEKERVFSEPEDKSASTLQSETFSSESQPQKDSETKDEQTSRAFSSSDRRKLGSSRRNKRGHRVKESTDEVLENSKADESIDTTLVSLKEKTVIQEKLTHELQSDVNVFLPHECSMFTVLVSSSEVHSSGTKDNPDTHLESFITKTVNPPVHPDQKDKNIDVKTFDKSGEAKPLKKSDSPKTKEVISLHGPIIVAEQKQRPETLQTQEQESLQIDQTHDPKTNDVLENPQTVSGILVDHSEIIKTRPSEFTQRSNNDSITKQEMLTQEDKMLMSSTTETSLNAAVQINEDIPVVGPKQIWITRTGVETAMCLHEDEEVVDKDKKHRAGQSVQEGDLSEAQWKDVSFLSPLSSLNAPSDLQLQDKPPSTDEQTDANFSFSGHRRKLGSSHKNKEKQHGKGPKEEDSENFKDEELETSQFLKIQTAGQEDLSQGNEHKAVLSTSQDSSMPLMFESQRIIPEKLQHDKDKRKPDIKTEMMEEPVDLTQQGVDQIQTFDKEKTSDVISESIQREVQEVKVHPKQMKESLQTGYPESLTGHAEMSMLTMKSGDDSGVKEVDYPTTRNILDDSDLKADDYDLSDTEKQPIRDTVDSSLSQVYEFKVRVEDEVKPNTEQMFHQEKERVFSEPEDKSASTLQSETFSSESQPQRDSETKDEQTSRAFSSSDRRKLGSSRRNKRGQRVKEPTDEVLENSKADESIDTALVSLKEKTVIQEKLTHELQSDVNVFLPHECSMFTVHVSSSEVHSSGTKDNPDTHLKSFITKTVNPPVHPDQKDKNIDVKTFDKSGEAKPLKKSDSPVTKEVISLHGPIIVAEQKQRPETLQTQEQESLQIDQTHDPKTNDVLENPQTVSGILVDHSEIIKTRPSEFTQRSNNDSITKQEMLTQEDKALMSSTTETSLNAAVQINEDIPVVGPKQIWITRTGVETAMCLHEDEEVVDKDKKHRAGQSVHQEGDLSEAQWKDVSVLSPLSSLDAPSDLQLQDKPPSTDEQTDANFSFSGHRRKLGSSRKNKGKQHGKGPKEEDSENFKDEELETSQLLKIQTAGQEDLSQGNEHKVVLSTSQDSSMPLMFESQRIIPEKLQHDKDKRKPDIKTEMMEEPVDLTQQGVDQIQTFDKEKTSDVISETTQRKVQEVKVHPKQMKESLQTGYPESLTGHAEMSILTMKSGGDDSGVKEVDYPTTRNILDDSDLKADDYDLSDTEKQPIRDTVDSSLSQVYEFKVRVEDEVKPNTEQMFHQEKERLFSEPEDKSASTLQSETFSSESQPQKDSETKDEQTSRAFSSSDRRKLGSSRRNKRGQRVKESTDEVLENTKADESIDTTLVSLKEKTVIQEKLTHELQSDVNVFLPHECSMFTVLVSSSEVHSSGTKDNPDTHLESFITKTVNPPVHPDQKDKNIDVKTFDKSGEAKPLKKSDSPKTKEVISLHGPIIVADQKQRPETLQTHEQESLQIDQTHDSKTNDVLENPQTVSGILVDHSEIIKTRPSEFTQRSNNDSITKQEMLTQEDKALMSSTTETSLNAAVQINEDIPVVGPKQIWITRTGVETAMCLHEDEEVVDKDKKHRAGQSVQEGDLSEAQWKDVSFLSPLSSLDAPSDLQLQDKPPSTDEQTDANFSFSGHRRKLGSSRKNKGKQHGKGPKEEDSENFKDEELETSQFLKIQTAGQEDLSQGNEHKAVLSTSQDSSMPLMFESQRIIPEKLQHDKDKRKPDIKTEMMEEPVDLTQQGVDQIQTFDKEKTSDVISESIQREVQEVKVHPKQMKESLQTGYPESLTGHAEMSMLTMKSGDDSGVKEVDYPTTRNILDDSDLKADDYDLSDTEKQPIRDTVDSSLSQVYEFKVRVEDEVKPNTEQMFHQEKERVFSEPEDKSASTLQSETFSSESQPQRDSETKDEQTSRAFSSSDRRKLGSSRRNKRGQRVKEPTDEVLENSKADESIDTALVSLKEKTVIQEKLTHELQSDVNVFLPHECSMFTVHVSSSEVHSSGTKDNPDTHLESFITKTVNPPVHPDQKDKNIDVKTFDKSGEAKPLKKSDSPVTKEVISLHGPIIVAEQKQRPETLQTQEKESLQIDQTHDPKTNDVLENPQAVSGILVDHSEIIKTRPSEFTQRSNNDSITKQEMLTQEDKALMSSTTETSLNAAVQINEDIPVVGPKQIWITRTGVETAMCLHEDEEVVDKDKKHRAGQSVHQEGDLSEAQWKDVSVLSPLSSLDAPSDLQLQDKPLSTDEQTDANFSFSGHRRKLGSSRKNKEKQHGKGPKEEDSENFKDEELETSQLLKIQTAGQEDLSQGNEHKVVLSTSQDSSMPLMFESQRIIPEKLQHDKDKRKPDIKTEMMEEPVDLTQQGVDQIQTFDKEKTSDVISESTQRKVQEVKVHPKQMKESLQTGYPESLTGHAEMSILTMKSGDDSGVKEVDYPTTRNILDDSDLKADDYDLSDTEKQPIRDTVDSSLSQVYEFKVRVEDEVKPNTEQMFHQEKERLFSEPEDKSASTLQSETISSESQPQKDSETKDEQTSRAFSSSDRRKLGSSRRNKRGQRVKESTDEVLENTKADESIDTTLVSLKEKTVIQEKLTHELQSDVNVFLPHECSMFTVLVSSSEVHSSGTKDNPDTHLESFITKTVNPPVHPDQKDKNIDVKTFDKSGEAKPLKKSDSPVTKEVISLHGPIIVAEQKQRPETLQTHEQESLQIDQTHDPKTNDVLENPQTVSGILVDHSEIIKTRPSEFTQRSNNDSITKQEMLTQEDKALMSSTTETSLNAAVQINEDIPVVGPKQIWITRTGVETAMCLHEDEEVVDKDKKHRAGQSVQEGDLSEAQWKDVSFLSPLSSLDAPSDLQLQDKPPSTDEQTDANFSFSGHRRKLGSSRKNKGKQHGKGPKEEDSENFKDEELETSQFLKIQTAGQEDLSQGNEHKAVLSTSQDSSMPLMFESQRIIPEKLQHDKDKRKPDIKTEMMEEPVDLTQQGVDQIQTFDKEKTSDVISESIQREVQEVKVHPKQMKESLQTGYPESLTGHAEMSMLTMKSGDDSGVKEVDYPTTRNILDDSDLKADDYDLSDTEKQPIRDTVDSSLSQVYEFKVRVEDEVKPNTEQMFHQEKERVFSEPEDKSASTLQSETFSSESQPQKDSETKDEQTSRAFSSSDRRKLGSSRRNKRGQRVKESTDEVLENSKADESIDTALVSLKEKTVIQEKLTHELQSDVNVFLPHECSMFTVLVSSSEVHSSGTKDNPDTHLESFITKTVNPPVHPDQKDKNIDVKTFDKSGEAKPLKKSDSPVTKEVISLHGPIIVAEQKQRPETLQTHEQESLQIDQTHDPKTNDVLENPQTVSGILVDHSEIIKTRPSEFTQRSNNDSITKQEMLTQEDKALMSSTTETSLNAAVQINEDIPVVGPKQIWITRTGVETAMCLHEDEEVVDKDKKHRAGQSVHQEGDLSEAQWKDVSVLSPLSSLDAPSDLQLQDKPPSTDEQTDPNFSFSGHRRKLGSSRKNKEKQHGKGPKEEDSENFKDEELETSQFLKIQTAGQEDLSQGNEHRVVLSTSQDSSMPLMFESQRIIPEKLQHDKDKRKPDIKTEMMEEPVDLTQQGVDQIQTFDKEKTSDVISETTQREVQEVKVHPKQMKESLQTGYPESLTGHAEMSMLTMKSGDDSGVKEVDYPTTRNILDDSDLKADDYDLSDTEKQPIRDTVDSSLSQVYEFKVRVEDEVKPNTEQMFHQEKERVFSETEDKSASTLQSETFSSESQPQKDSETKDEQTSRAFSSSDRRKLGSSRRNKRGQRVKESTDEVLENSKADEIPENSKVLSSDPPDYLETIPQSLPDCEQDSEDHSDRESSVFANLVKKSTNFSQQEVDKYLTASTRDLLGDDQRIKVHSTQQSLHTCYSPVSGDTENLDIFSGNLSEQAEMFGFTKKSESASTDELYPTKVRMSVASDLKPGTENPHAGDSALSQVHQPGSVRDPTTSGHKRKLASSRRLKGGHTVKDPDAETHDKPVQDLVEEASSFRLIESSDITPRRAHSTSNVDQKVPNGSMIQDGDLSSRKRDERTELPTKDKNSHENVLASKPHSFPFTTDVNSEINTSRDRTISENIAGSKSPKNDAYESSQHAIDAVRKAQVQEVDPGQVCAEKEKGEAVGKNEKTAQKSFYLTENKEMFDFVSSGRDFSVTSEGTTEKSIPRNHNEIECSVEQKAYSSPQDRLPTAGEQDKSINISEAARKHQLEDFVSKEHAEQINPDQMQETCHIDSTSLVQNTSFVQTLQSDANVAVDFNCADHDQSNKNETHSDLKAAEGRRKLGSSRRIKGRQQAKFSETNQENKEEDNEITDEATQMSATKTSREDFKPVEKVTTIVAEAEQTEKLPTTLGGSSVSTPEINSSSDKDDFTKSNKNTDEKHIELLHGTDSFCLITHCGLEKEGLMQSQSFVSEGDSDLQSSLKHDEIISILSGSESVFDQDQTIQRQNREARTLGQGVELQQMLEDTQTARGFSSEDHDRNSSVDAQEPRLDELRENLLRAERGLSTSLEFISPSEESAMDLAYKKAISLKVDASEGLQETSMFKKRKIGSSRRTKINRKQEGETPSMDEPKDDDISTQDDVWNLEKVEVMVELPLIKEVKESLNVHNLHGARENDEAKTTRYDKHQQAVPEQRSKSTSEGVQSQALEVKSSSPDFSSTSRRKMGSTCKNLGSQTQREILHQGEEPKIEAAESETPAGGAASERILQIKGVRLHSETKDSDQRTEKAFQPVEITHVEESLLKPPAEEMPDESPVSLSQVDETKQTLHISPSSSPQNDSVLKSVRRKKFGSNRRSHLQPRNKNQDEKEDGVIQIHNEDHTREIVEEAADRNRDESPDLDKISEVLEKSSSNLPETKELSEPVNEKTPGRSYHDEICFSQDSRRQNYLGNLGGANASDSYNVVMIGDSCVGKTSFMKRAQSGKFSLDIPASVGVDSCMWTVVVDGKPVMLQLWDTAGQERFHSITRQVFHRAQAFLLMYDITCSQSFSAVSYWVNCIQEAAAEDVSVLLLGNKSDDEQRQVKTEEGDNLAKEYNFAFMECSAATGQNVIESLETMARMLSQSADLREKTTQLHKQPAQKKQSSCC